MASASPTPLTCPVDEVTGKLLETPEIRAEGLRQLRERMQASVTSGAVARFPRTDDQFLLPFLRARKYAVEKAHMVITNFAKFWYDPKNREVIDGLCIARAKPFMELGMARMLSPRTDRKGNALALLFAGDLDFGKFNYKMQMESAVYFLAHVFEDESVQLHGLTYAETFRGFSLIASMTAKKAMSSSEQQAMMKVFTDTFPMRIRDIWVINQPWYFTMFWTVVKPFLSKKLTKRVHFLGSDIAALHAAIDPANLPAEFGGTLDEPADRFVRDMEEHERRHGKLGGFAIPFSVDDPTGAIRAASGKAAAPEGDFPPVKPEGDPLPAAAAAGAGAI